MTSFLFLILTLRKLRASQRCEDKSPRRAQGHPSGHSRECSHGAILWERRSPRRCPDARPAPSPCEEGPTCVAGKGRQLPRELCAPHNGAPPPTPPRHKAAAGGARKQVASPPSARMQRRSPGSRAAEILGRDTCAESPAEACAARTPFVLPTQVWPGDFNRP